MVRHSADEKKLEKIKKILSRLTDIEDDLYEQEKSMESSYRDVIVEIEKVIKS